MSQADQFINAKEKLLVEYALSDRSLFTQLYNILNPRYFDKPLDQVMGFVTDYFKKYHNVPTPDIIDAELGIQLELHQFDNGEWEYAFEELESHCQNEAMRHAILSSVDHLEENKMSSIFNEIREALMVKADNDLGTDHFEDPFNRLTAMQETLEQRPIGIDKLDTLLDEVRRGELGIFAAGTGGGKSIILSNVAMYMARQKLDILILSVELSEEMITKRMDSMITGVNTKEVFSRIDDVVDILDSERDNYGSIRVKRMPSSASPSMIRTYLMEYHLTYGKYPDVICLDYIDILKPDDSKLLGDNKFNIDEHLTFSVRDIMAEYDIYGFTASQLNRDAVDKTEINYGMIAGGISKVNASDFTVAIYATQEDIDNCIVNIRQLKVRNTAKTTQPIQLYLNPHTLKITSDLPDLSVSAPSQHKLLGGRSGQSKGDAPATGKKRLQASLKAI